MKTFWAQMWVYDTDLGNGRSCDVHIRVTCPEEITSFDHELGTQSSSGPDLTKAEFDITDWLPMIDGKETGLFALSDADFEKINSAAKEEIKNIALWNCDEDI